MSTCCNKKVTRAANIGRNYMGLYCNTTSGETTKFKIKGGLAKEKETSCSLSLESFARVPLYA